MGIGQNSAPTFAAKHHPDPIRAFTLTFDRADYDEEKEAREMAVKVGAEFFPIPIRQDDLADHLSDAVLQSEALCLNAHGVAKYLLSRAVRDAGYKVVLTGEGSDEILGGYLHFRRDMVANNGNGTRPNIAAAFSQSAALSCNGNGRDLDGVRRLLGFVPGWMETSFALSAKMHAVLSGEFLNSYAGHDGFRSFFNDIDVASQLAGREPLNQSLYLWAKTR